MPQVRPAQRAERKQQIIDNAFETWGHSAFFHTRLDDVARRLGITKPALYRYFGSKEELLKAMEQQLLASYGALGQRLEADLETQPPSQTVSRFIRDRIAFFASHIPEFLFTLHQIGLHQDGAVVRALTAQSQLLAGCLARMPGITNPPAAASYVRTTVSFFLMSEGFDKESHQPRALSEGEQERLATLVEQVCENGYAAAGAEEIRPQMEALERSCAVTASDMPPDDPILRAVAETVAEHGFAEASIERIARRAGLTKSSLYFHFRDRDDMFARLVERHQKRLQELFMTRSATCETVWQRLYCFLEVLASYLHNAREIPAVLNWFRYHGYQLRMRHPDEAMLARWFAFLTDAVRDSLLVSYGLPASHIGSHLSFVVVNHITLAGRDGVARPADLRQIYDLFMHGIQGVR